MMGPNFTDEIDCGSFFNHIDDLLDFPAEDATYASSSNAVPINPPVWSTNCDSVIPGSSAPELSVPYEDIEQLEWLSNFVEESFSGGGSLTMKKAESSSTNTNQDDSTHTQFHSASPVSVFESSSFSSGEKAPEIHIPIPCGRARSKRARPSTFNPHPILQLISPASLERENIFMSSSDSENFVNFAESHMVNKLLKQPFGEHKKKKKIKVSLPSTKEQNNTESQVVRKCLHCEITKTPQWRTGPMGPKTLCNACGVRYKSGRLFPEYRPAASPTFCAAFHSNSHKKVLEMRNKSGNIIGSAADSDVLPELIPNTNNSLTLEEYM